MHMKKGKNGDLYNRPRSKDFKQISIWLVFYLFSLFFYVYMICVLFRAFLKYKSNTRMQYRLGKYFEEAGVNNSPQSYKPTLF
jgi:hypothetical protein